MSAVGAAQLEDAGPCCILSLPPQVRYVYYLSFIICAHYIHLFRVFVSACSATVCSNKTFNLWWEMYASRPVIEGTNLDANVRQAVNHFEFNAALVSKKVR